MKRILLTGCTGFVGRNILPNLRKEFETFSPTRQQLDLMDQEAVLSFVKNNNIDIVFHTANPNPAKNQLDQSHRFFCDSLRVFTTVFECRWICEKVIYIGSGAEYNKKMNISSITEDQIGRSIPTDEYGLSKYIMNQMAVGTENVYNMRLFACFGPYDHESKFITHAIQCCLRNEPISIRQDCWFDYLHVDDLAEISSWFVRNTPRYHDYNICSGRRISLFQIADYIRTEMKNPYPNHVQQEGMNLEYTASNERLLHEMTGFMPLSIYDGIQKQIEWQRRNGV